MSAPRVSVILPAYNQEAYIGTAIQSVLEQAYADWELIVVDDGSMDGTAGVVKGFADTRIRYIGQENLGVPAARNTGIQNAVGEYLTFLDGDDTYLPAKLGSHVSHLDEHPDVGLSYAGRIETWSDGTPFWMLSAPEKVTLAELVMGFPFAINDFMVRSEWVGKTGGFDNTFRLHAEDPDLYYRLALSGCKFGRLNRFVSHRRVYENRVLSRIPDRINALLLALQRAFSDPRCPASVQALQGPASARVYLVWSLQELAQGELQAGQEHLRRAIELDPSLQKPFKDHSSGVLRNIVWFSLRYASDHVPVQERIFGGLTAEFDEIRAQEAWAQGYGYLFRGGREVLWDRMESGETCFTRAAQQGARIDEDYIQTFTDQLMSFELEYGSGAADKALGRLLPYLRRFGSPAMARRFESLFAMNAAFKEYRSGCYGKVPRKVMRAVTTNPALIGNRGVLSILVRSLNSLISGQDRYEKVGNAIVEREVERL